MPTSETIATAITGEHKHVPVKVTSWPIVSWAGRCLRNCYEQTGALPMVLYVHPETLDLIQRSLFDFECAEAGAGYKACEIDNTRVEATSAVPRYCASVLLNDNRVAVVDHNAEILVCL